MCSGALGDRGDRLDTSGWTRGWEEAGKGRGGGGGLAFAVPSTPEKKKERTQLGKGLHHGSDRLLRKRLHWRTCRVWTGILRHAVVVNCPGSREHRLHSQTLRLSPEPGRYPGA